MAARRLRVVVKAGISIPVTLEKEKESCTLKDVRKKLLGIVSGDYKFSLNATDPLLNENSSLLDLGLADVDLIHIIQREFQPKLTVAESFDFASEQATPPSITPATSEKRATPTSNEVLPQGVLSTSKLGTFLTNGSEDCSSKAQRDIGGVAVLCEALHMMMLDSGFQHDQKEKQVSTSSLSRYNYIAPLGPMVPINMVCTSVGPQLVTHASITLPDDNRSQVATCVLPLDQFLSTESSVISQKDAKSSSRLCNTSKLTQHFTDAVPHRLLTDLRRALNLPETGTILCLSHEIKIFIMTLLDVKTVLTLSRVNREFYRLTQDYYLWRKFFIRDFSKGLLELPDNEEVSSWKKLYEKQAELEKIRQEQLLSPATHWREINPYSLPPHNFHPPIRPLFARHQRPRFNPYIPPGPLIDPSCGQLIIDSPSRDLIISEPFDVNYWW